MHLIEHELKRWDIWNEQTQTMSPNSQQKLNFAMKKQDHLIMGIIFKKIY